MASNEEDNTIVDIMKVVFVSKDCDFGDGDLGGRIKGIDKGGWK